MKCNITNRSDLIARYLSGELPEIEAVKFEEHYFQCELCFREFKLAEDSLEMIHSEGPEVFSGIKYSETVNNKFSLSRILSFKTSPGWRIALGVSSVVVLFIIAIFIFMQKEEIQIAADHPPVITDQSEEPVNEQQAEIQKEIETAGKDDLALLDGPAFQPVPYLEEWMKDNVRNITNYLKDISPANGSKFFDEDITFKWSLITEEEISIVILDNLEKEILIVQPDQNQIPNYSIKVKSDSFKKSGLYYWRIEDENEILYIGKLIFVKSK